MKKDTQKLNEMAKAIYIRTEDKITSHVINNRHFKIHREVSYPERIITIRIVDEGDPSEYKVFTIIDRIRLNPN